MTRPFGKEKMFMVGNLRAHFEQNKVRIPEKFQLARWQLKRYRYQEGTNKPEKKDDHIPDSFMCAFQKWPLNKKAMHLKDTTKEQQEKFGWTPITAGIRNKVF